MNNEIILNRVYLYDGSAVTHKDGTSTRRLNGFTQNSSHYFLFYHSADSTKEVLHCISKNPTGGIGVKHFENIGGVQSATYNPDNGYIYVTTGNATVTKISTSNWTATTLSTKEIVASISYDKVTKKLYGRGKESNYYAPLYTLVESGNSLEITNSVTLYNPIQNCGTSQGITANNGLIYRLVSNPNHVIVYDSATGSIKDLLAIHPRINGIISAGECEDMDYYNGELYINCYNVFKHSGCNYQNMITKFNTSLPSTINIANIYETNPSIYVDYNTVVAAEKLNKYLVQNQNGSQTYPFKTLHEAIECANGLFDRYGLTSNIVVKSIQSTSVGTIRIDKGIKAISPVSGVYVIADNIECNNSDVVLNKIIINGYKADTNQPTHILVYGGNVVLQDIYFKKTTSHFNNSADSIIKVNGGGTLYYKKFASALPSGYSGTLWNATNLPSGKTFIRNYVGIVKVLSPENVTPKFA